MKRVPLQVALCGMLLALGTGCLAPVASLYPPAPGAPTDTVWVVNHGWHTGLVVVRSAIPRGLIPELADFPAARYLEFGWGDADFYQARDPGAWLALRAALLSRSSVVHIVGRPVQPEEIFTGQDVVEIRLSRGGFEALAQFVNDSLAREGQRAASQLGAGPYGTSAFYASRDRYHLLNTCNTWIALALRAAGLPITPFYAMSAGNLMWQMRRLPHRDHASFPWEPPDTPPYPSLDIDEVPRAP